MCEESQFLVVERRVAGEKACRVDVIFVAQRHEESLDRRGASDHVRETIEL